MGRKRLKYRGYYGLKTIRDEEGNLLTFNSKEEARRNLMVLPITLSGGGVSEEELRDKMKIRLLLNGI